MKKNNAAFRVSSLFSHPRELSDLFFINMWEAVSFFGTQSLLIFYLVNELGIPEANSLKLFGAVAAFSFGSSIVGGIIGDRFFSKLNCILIGCSMIMLCHLGLAVADWFTVMPPGANTDSPDLITLASLALLTCGVGMMKPNSYTLLGCAYDSHPDKRDSGFALYFMGVSLGAVIGIYVCGYVGQTFGYHYGFGVAAIGQAIGIGFIFAGHGRLSRVEAASRTERAPYNASKGVAGTSVMLALFLVAFYSMSNPEILSYIIAGVVLFCIVFLTWFAVKSATATERSQLLLAVPFLIGGLAFFTISEQGGGAIALLAERAGDFENSLFIKTPAQVWSTQPFFVILFSPIVALLWTYLSERNINPDATLKFFAAFLICAVGVSGLYTASTLSADGTRIALLWIIGPLMFFSIAEILIITIGGSLITRLAPKEIAGFFFGCWTMTLASGSFLAARLSSFTTSFSDDGSVEHTVLFSSLFVLCIGAAIFMFIAWLVLRKRSPLLSAEPEIR